MNKESEISKDSDCKTQIDNCETHLIPESELPDSKSSSADAVSR